MEEGEEKEAADAYMHITNPVLLDGCNFKGVSSYFIYDNGEDHNYLLKNFVMTNCTVSLTPNDKMDTSNGVLIYMTKGKGYINFLSIENSTIWSNDGSKYKFFIQYTNTAGSDRAGYGKLAGSQSVSLKNCTFYNVANNSEGVFGNYDRFKSKDFSSWTVTNCIFKDSFLKKNIPQSVCGGGNPRPGTATFLNNTYMKGDTFDSTEGSVAGSDESGTAIEADPEFVDPDKGDFTVKGSEQLSRKTGDPRWLE